MKSELKRNQFGCTAAVTQNGRVYTLTTLGPNRRTYEVADGESKQTPRYVNCVALKGTHRQLHRSGSKDGTIDLKTGHMV